VCVCVTKINSGAILPGWNLYFDWTNTERSSGLSGPCIAILFIRFIYGQYNDRICIQFTERVGKILLQNCKMFLLGEKGGVQKIFLKTRKFILFILYSSA